MIIKFNIAAPFGNAPKRSKICPKCGKAQILKWDNVNGGRNIILIHSIHEYCGVTIEDCELEEVA